MPILVRVTMYHSSAIKKTAVRVMIAESDWRVTEAVWISGREGSNSGKYRGLGPNTRGCMTMFSNSSDTPIAVISDVRRGARRRGR